MASTHAMIMVPEELILRAIEYNVDLNAVCDLAIRKAIESAKEEKEFQAASC